MQPCDQCWFWQEVADDPKGKDCRFPWLDPQPEDILKKLCSHKREEEEDED